MSQAYFNKQTFTFLEQLEQNNNRDWFNQNKHIYEKQVRSPALSMIEDMAKLLPDLSPHFRAIPKKVGGSLMRIHRDARFSKDKTPYKLNIGIHFRHETAKDAHAPGFYLHISAQQSFLGAGIWRPESSVLRRIRSCIDENSRTWTQITQNAEFKQNFRFGGHSLTNGPRGFDREHPLIEDLKRKDFIIFHDLKRSEITSANLLQNNLEHFTQTADFMRYLCFALELSFD